MGRMSWRLCQRSPRASLHVRDSLMRGSSSHDMPKRLRYRSFCSLFVEPARLVWKRHAASAASGAGASASTKVGFGKYKDLTYAEALAKDPEYCKWLLGKFQQEHPSEKPSPIALAPFMDWLQTAGSCAVPAASRSASTASVAPTAASPRRPWTPPAAAVARHPPARGPPAPGATADPAAAALGISGSLRVGFGTHAHMTYEEVLQRVPQYCDWLVDAVMKPRERPHGAHSVPSLQLALYCLGARLAQAEAAAEAAGRNADGGGRGNSEGAIGGMVAAPQFLTVEGRTGCLLGTPEDPQVFVLSGEVFGGCWPREQVRSLVVAFGGIVRGSVSGKTRFVVQGEPGQQWRPKGEESQKCVEARSRGIPILRWEDLLSLIRVESERGNGQQFSFMLACSKSGAAGK
eukprot:TRINITY_DN2620_c0_g1_i1.p1 TRINITY_DN2620_c0_g1~~TRINITY_DN2620_c0_g1_i1.p1  ORF type:complete len:404 (+),score=50.74 TRINITY_DN2620_c0_g1_i1:39-1250(+)